ncbi:stimulated by retinoic acid gene 6 protein-like [Saccostrea echinata]|uniref:stimulated by retinoic acid gene 6 protein-like n=1 Tax=Saccostrea echinata TaxID=191078 RepID=UPI002A833B80|nr:stimulated by retinoic acid gene 6 protein-like [Saccostrea echinata]
MTGGKGGKIPVTQKKNQESVFLEVTDVSNTTNSSTDLTCSYVEQLLYGYNALVGLGIFTILVLIFLEKRNYKKDVFCGRPGLPVPINILDGNKNVLPTAACFGCCINYLFYILFLRDDSTSVDPWLATFYLLKNVIFMGISYYPLFSCVNSPSKFGPPIIGLLYTIFLFLISLTEYNYCVNDLIELCGYIPFFICEGYLLCVFAFRLVYQIYKCATGKARRKSKVVAKSSQYTHVRELLDKHQEAESVPLGYMLKSRTLQIVEEAKLCCLNRSIQLCTMRTVAVNFIVLLSFYQLFIVFVDVSNAVRKLNRGLILQLRAWNVSADNFEIYLDSVSWSFIVAQVLSALYVISTMIMMYYSQRQHLLSVWRGDRSFIPKKCLEMDSRDMVTKSLIYAGTQVSHLLGGYLISVLVVFVLCMILAFFVILPLLGKVPEAFLQPVKFLIPSVVVTFIFVYALKKLSEKIFLQKYWISSKNGVGVERTLALDNRKVYHNFSFFLFFFYILIGLFKCLRRVMYSLVIGLVFVPRLDRSVLVSGFEHYDNGYMIYIGLLHVELVHCHPVLRVFCEELLKSLKEHDDKTDLSLHSPNSSKTELARKSYSSVRSISARAYNNQIYNKWMKMLTLSNNSSLCKTSKTNKKFEQPRLNLS